MRRYVFALGLLVAVDCFLLHVPFTSRPGGASSRPGFVSGWIIPFQGAMDRLVLRSEVGCGAAGRRLQETVCRASTGGEPGNANAASKEGWVQGVGTKSLDWVRRGAADRPKANQITGMRTRAHDSSAMKLTGMIKQCGAVRELAMLVRSSQEP